MFQKLLGLFKSVTPKPVVTRVPTPGPTVAIVNQSTVVTDQQLVPIVAALQIQVDRDFSPVWKLDANLQFVPRGTAVPTNAWIIYVMDTSDQQGALGYHDLTAQGNPIAKVFARDDQKYGLSLSVTLSHELLEMLVDPYISNCVFSQQTNTTGTLYAYEVCDAPEDDSFGYQINGVLVSDFVYPSWFEDFRAPNSTKFDFKGVLHAPFQLASGGYIGLFEVKPGTTGWTQKTAEGAPGARMLAHSHAYGRMNRRKTAKVINT